jgi:hypothetical protein
MLYLSSKVPIPPVLYKAVPAQGAPRYVWAPNALWATWQEHLRGGRAVPFTERGRDVLGRPVFLCSDDIATIELVLALPDGV